MTPAIWIHALSYLVLGIFFEVPELSLNVFCLWLSGREQTLEQRLSRLPKILRVRYILTHVVGPSSGIMVMTSGLYLVHVGGRSLHEAWIFWILLASTVGLYKGLIQHNFYVKSLLRRLQTPEARSAGFVKDLRRVLHSPFDQCLIFLEFPTYVFTYAAAYFKPAWPNPFDGLVSFLEGLLKTPVLAGVCLVAAGSLLIVPLRLSMARFSRASG